MTLTKKTKEEDDRLRKELEHADIEKFKKAIKSLIKSTKRPAKKVSPSPIRK